ncbi:hypothetical protein Pelo_14511 [Pelomyxa schiedti]|nr:hypothetical protein Pelo_14511 [Pelomyxa schiedti]
MMFVGCDRRVSADDDDDVVIDTRDADVSVSADPMGVVANDGAVPPEIADKIARIRSLDTDSRTLDKKKPEDMSEAEVDLLYTEKIGAASVETRKLVEELSGLVVVDWSRIKLDEDTEKLKLEWFLNLFDSSTTIDLEWVAALLGQAHPYTLSRFLITHLRCKGSTDFPLGMLRVLNWIAAHFPTAVTRAARETLLQNCQRLERVGELDNCQQLERVGELDKGNTFLRMLIKSSALRQACIKFLDELLQKYIVETLLSKVPRADLSVCAMGRLIINMLYLRFGELGSRSLDVIFFLFHLVLKPPQDDHTNKILFAKSAIIELIGKLQIAVLTMVCTKTPVNKDQAEERNSIFSLTHTMTQFIRAILQMLPDAINYPVQHCIDSNQVFQLLLAIPPKTCRCLNVELWCTYNNQHILVIIDLLQVIGILGGLDTMLLILSQFLGLLVETKTIEGAPTFNTATENKAVPLEMMHLFVDVYNAYDNHQIGLISSFINESLSHQKLEYCANVPSLIDILADIIASVSSQNEMESVTGDCVPTLVSLLNSPEYSASCPPGCAENHLCVQQSTLKFVNTVIKFVVNPAILFQMQHMVIEFFLKLLADRTHSHREKLLDETVNTSLVRF